MNEGKEGATSPIGDIFIASIPFSIITKISFFDVRRVIQEERDVERYPGIQRPLDPTRVAKLVDYVNFFDASFPTAIIISVDDEYATYDEQTHLLTLSNTREDEEKPTIAMSNLVGLLNGIEDWSELKSLLASAGKQNGTIKLQGNATPAGVRLPVKIVVSAYRERTNAN